jgi:hypothetical protein
MPYRSKGRRVYVKRGGKWVLLKVHRSEAEARAHAAALNINVRHGR